MNTITPTDGMRITEDTKLAPGVHFLPGGIDIVRDGVTLDGSGATLVGTRNNIAAIRAFSLRDVTVRNLTLRDYHYGVHAEDCKGLIVRDCTFRTSG